jgi:Dyp-type peroxidase family
LSEGTAVIDEALVQLELDDIQSGVLSPRPTPYAASYLLVRIDDPAAGRELISRLLPLVSSVASARAAPREVGVSVAVTHAGLKALGVPAASLESFAWEFRQGMAARASALGDVGESAPSHWEWPLGTQDVHLVVVGLAGDAARLESAMVVAREKLADLAGIAVVWRQDCFAPPDEREPFGFRDGISHPAVEGAGVPGSNPLEAPLKAGEFVLGYRDETGGFPPSPQPDILGRNGTYVAFRKLHQKVASFRRFLRDNAKDPADEELVAAKMMGRWRSGAPLALCPMHDDAELGADPARHNAFLYQKEDPAGLVTPKGSHCRRTHPRDTPVAGTVRLHRMIRRGTVYGPPLPPGVVDDDGQDRGIIFAFVGSHLKRQFEFVQSEWIHQGAFLGLGDAKDPVATSTGGETTFSIPRKGLPRRLAGLSSFVVTRGGEYAFLPGLAALRWLAGGGV